MQVSSPRMSGNGTSAASVSEIWLRALAASATLADDPALTLPVLVERMAAAQGDAPALIADETALTYSQLADAMRRASSWALSQDLAKGDVVAVAMVNSPELVATWLGLTRIGVVAALLNTNLTGTALAHCIRISGARAIIADDELSGAVSEAATTLAKPLPVFPSPVREEVGNGKRLEARASDMPPSPSLHHHGEGRASVTLSDPALLIYTSGTTGLPKAAYVSHHRVMSWSRWFSALIDVNPSDRLYDCLPMYHSVGGVAAVGAVLAGGGSVVVARRFSASQFWTDVVRHRCTLFQYIGELCRYLVNTPPCAAETSHTLRLCCGNGLSKDVWEAFQARFRVPRILEFYAATEGNFSLYNVEGNPGSIGRIPAYLAPRMSVEIVKVDAVSGAPVRDGDGRCCRCTASEPGEAIARIGASPADRSSRFEGYTSAADSDRKILRDCFEPGDRWLRSGDLMRRDKAGFFYFVDRLGDTFRWKGENVATTEVAEAIASFPGVLEANVYGVSVPAHEGRAGMAALVVDGGFDLAGLHAHLAERLPVYARPLFLRVCTELAATATFKQVKSALAAQGFDPAAITDPLYLDDPSSRGYVPLDATLYAEIVSGSIRI